MTLLETLMLCRLLLQAAVRVWLVSARSCRLQPVSPRESECMLKLENTTVEVGLLECLQLMHVGFDLSDTRRYNTCGFP